MKLKTKLLAAAAALAVSAAATAQIWGPVVGGLINGGVLYGAGGVVAQDSTKFFWDGTNHRLGIGNAAPTVPLDVTGAAAISGATSIGGVLTLGSTINGAVTSNAGVSGTTGAFSSTLNVTGLTTLSGGLKGTTTNDSASGGNVGEYTESIVTAGGAVSLSTGIPKTITSISLTAGDWDVSGMCKMTGNAATTISYSICSTSLVTNTNGAEETMGAISYSAAGQTVLAGTDPRFPTATYRYSLAGTTTVYLVIQTGFGASTPSGYGIIRARRIR